METSLLSALAERLTSVSDTPALDASVLVAHIVHKPRTWVMAHPELTLTPEQTNQLEDSLTRLARGESFPYVLGHWEFFGLDFDVTPDVLIPRPETELLVEKAIAWLQQSPGSKRIADVGTGAGTIAVSIAVNVPNAHVLATDISPEALEIARKNAVKLGVASQIDFVQCDLLPEYAGSTKQDPFDLICANLPYIPTTTLHSLPIFGREPTLALDGGTDGLEIIRRLFDVVPRWIRSNGMMLLEIESTQGIQIRHLARDFFSNATINLYKDLAGQDRLLDIRL